MISRGFEPRTHQVEGRKEYFFSVKIAQIYKKVQKKFRKKLKTVNFGIKFAII